MSQSAAREHLEAAQSELEAATRELRSSRLSDRPGKALSAMARAAFLLRTAIRILRG